MVRNAKEYYESMSKEKPHLATRFPLASPAPERTGTHRPRLTAVRWPQPHSLSFPGGRAARPARRTMRDLGLRDSPPNGSRRSDL